ncbi:hypothetical protein DMB66_52235 [Actinoplanes sp. ATCC 53533]|uniref:DUF998 domain-containing protein n=1 Tax=Actinoplanes sp. ATCC 53533 TaxID=1288362 RepID=UPI000F7909E7|nr:DUF998 domain-containing protein [Actinoplanes sp. ATCC 53533]RSM44524.1 hypothetical protein DMB66_52235 [Actinoplanes sp. ATCC 53533]
MNGGKRLLPAFGALAAAQMIVVSTLDGLTRPGYDETRNWISQLSLGANGWHGTVNLATCGLWVILCAIGLHRQADGRAVALILWCGLCLVTLAVVRTDAGLGFPPEVPEEHTTRGLIHKLISVTLGVAGIGAVARTGPRRPARVVASVMTVSFAAAGVLVLLDDGDVLPGNPSGLLERVALFAGLGWLGWLGLVSGRAAGDSSVRRRGAASPTGVE